MEKFRIKEEKYKSGNSKFFPQIWSYNVSNSGNWKTLTYKMFGSSLGFNDNGLDWCETLEESQKFIENFRLNIENFDDKLIEIKIHEIK